MDIDLRDSVFEKNIEKREKGNSCKMSEEIVIESKKTKKKIGIYQQMFIGFTVFTAITVLLLWVFQIFLLAPFYRAIRTGEMKSTSQNIERILKSGEYTYDEITEQCIEIFNKTDINILICDELGNNMNGVYNPYIPLYLSRLSRDDCINIFNEVRSLGGTYSFFEEEKRGFGGVKPLNAGDTYIYIATPFDSNSNNWLILLETEITPVDSTVDTLKIQLWCLTAVMVLMGIFLAVFIARKISKPIVLINQSAKQLALGNTDIEFASGGSREVRELSETLNYAAGELSKVEHLRRELLSNVSHDLRTPLTMIKGYGEVMRDLPGENTPENVQIIVDEAERLSNLVRDLLDLSTIESGTVPLTLEKFNLTDDIRNTLKRYDKLADYTFEFDYSEDVFVNADRLKISQVVYNLVNNAIIYAGEDKTVYLRQGLNGDKVCIEVTDHGEGIPADKLRDIWERYYKVDKEHKMAQVGTGLGLSIVKNILNMHGGEYGVTSEIGVGSTFWFELNRIKEDENSV